MMQNAPRAGQKSHPATPRKRAAAKPAPVEKPVETVDHNRCDPVAKEPPPEVRSAAVLVGMSYAEFLDVYGEENAAAVNEAKGPIPLPHRD